MKTRLLALVGLSVLVLGSASDAFASPQRGSKGSSGSSASPSRGSGGSGGSASRPSASRPSSSGHASQGSRGSSPAPRPSGGGSSVAPSPSRGSGYQGGSGGSVRPSAPPSVRPSTTVPQGTTRTVTPSYPSSRPTYPGSSTGTRTVPAPTLPDSSGSGTSGRDLYEGRALPSGEASSMQPGAGSPSSASPGLSIPTARTQPRIRFPAPYSPAGTASRGSGLVPRAGGSVTAPSKSPDARGSGPTARRDTGPVVSYDRGPTARVDAPRSVTPTKPVVTPAQPKPSVGKGKGGAGPRASGKPAREVTGSVKSWRDVRRSDPDGGKEIFVATKLAGRAHEIATGVAVGSIGGVAPGGFRGGLDLDDDWVCDPWGWDCGGWGWSWGCSWGWGWGWCGWSWPWYWSWYYPCWWWYSRPYYYTDYVYYPVTTVVYSEPQVVYVESASEPVGEAVVTAPAAGAAAPRAPAESPLSIAAQRYLELGDRAFREGRYTDAVQFYAKAVEFAPDQGALYLVLSDALFAAGDYHYGAYAIRRALELDPALVESTVDKHGFYPRPEVFDEQLATLERYLDEHPTDRDARLVLAMNYLFGGRAADAVRTIEGHTSAMADDDAAQKVLARARAVAGN